MQELEKITPAECQQMVEMYNWAAKEESIASMSLRVFKQYNKLNKTNAIVYEIEVITYNGRWGSMRCKGMTLSEAMNVFSKDWAAR